MNPKIPIPGTQKWFPQKSSEWFRIASVMLPLVLFSAAYFVGNWLWTITKQGTLPVAVENPLPHAFKDNPGGMVWLVALVAFCTGAFVQMLKELFPIRRHYQRAAVRRWLTQRSGNREAGANPVIRDLELLASGLEELTNKSVTVDQDDGEFYHLPTEQMMGQISAASEMAVSDPGNHVYLVLALASPGMRLDSESKDDRDLNYSALSPAMQYLLLCEVKKAEEHFPKAKETKLGVRGVFEGGIDAERGRLRSDIMVNVHRALDGLQVHLVRGWRRRLMRLCFLTSAVVSIVVVPLISSFQSHNQPEDGIGFGTIVFAIGFCWLTGGLFAPLAHDLMASVRRIGR